MSNTPNTAVLFMVLKVVSIVIRHIISVYYNVYIIKSISNGKGGTQTCISRKNIMAKNSEKDSSFYFFSEIQFNHQNLVLRQPCFLSCCLSNAAHEYNELKAADRENVSDFIRSSFYCFVIQPILYFHVASVLTENLFAPRHSRDVLIMSIKLGSAQHIARRSPASAMNLTRHVAFRRQFFCRLSYSHFGSKKTILFKAHEQLHHSKVQRVNSFYKCALFVANSGNRRCTEYLISSNNKTKLFEIHQSLRHLIELQLNTQQVKRTSIKLL